VGFDDLEKLAEMMRRQGIREVTADVGPDGRLVKAHLVMASGRVAVATSPDTRRQPDRDGHVPPQPEPDEADVRQELEEKYDVILASGNPALARHIADLEIRARRIPA
jgi:hypothetical protein